MVGPGLLTRGRRPRISGCIGNKLDSIESGPPGPSTTTPTKTTKSRKSPEPRIARHIWAIYEPEIRDLYPSKTLEEVRAYMRKAYSFNPTRRQFVHKLKTMGLRKYKTQTTSSESGGGQQKGPSRKPRPKVHKGTNKLAPEAPSRVPRPSESAGAPGTYHTPHLTQAAGQTDHNEDADADLDMEDDFSVSFAEPLGSARSPNHSSGDLAYINDAYSTDDGSGEQRDNNVDSSETSLPPPAPHRPLAEDSKLKRAAGGILFAIGDDTASLQLNAPLAAGQTGAARYHLARLCARSIPAGVPVADALRMVLGGGVGDQYVADEMFVQLVEEIRQEMRTPPRFGFHKSTHGLNPERIRPCLDLCVDELRTACRDPSRVPLLNIPHSSPLTEDWKEALQLVCALWAGWPDPDRPRPACWAEHLFPSQSGPTSEETLFALCWLIVHRSAPDPSSTAAASAAKEAPVDGGWEAVYHGHGDYHRYHQNHHHHHNSININNGFAIEADNNTADWMAIDSSNTSAAANLVNKWLRGAEALQARSDADLSKMLDYIFRDLAARPPSCQDERRFHGESMKCVRGYVARHLRIALPYAAVAAAAVF